jgi:dinuclear metal center YbgI/SA1388 family protein
MLLNEFEKYIGLILETERYRDYCPNGLQVEGRGEVNMLVTGVTASLDFLKAAVNAGADAVLVHHGYFWKNEDARIVGVKRARIEWLLRHNISLLAYHLPLDAHPHFGNNAQLAGKLGAELEGWFGEQNIAAHGFLHDKPSLAAWVEKIGANLGRQPLMIGDANQPIHRVAWCSGGGQGYFEQAVQLGVDAFLTGEISEQNVHFARETGVAFIAAGHHATERYGVQALGEHLAERFGIEHHHIEIANPV